MKPKTKIERQLPAISEAGSFYGNYYKTQGFGKSLANTSYEHESTNRIFDRHSKATFNPIASSLPFTGLQQPSIDFEDLANSKKASSVIELTFLKPLKPKRRKLFSLCIILILFIAAAAGFLSVKEKEKKDKKETESQEETSTAREELLRACEGDDAELSRFQIARNIDSKQQSALRVRLENMDLACFPSDPFRYVEKQLTGSLELFNCSIGVVADGVMAENAFDNLGLRVTESTVKYFGNQRNAKIPFFYVVGSEIIELPQNLLVDSLFLDSLVNFEFTEVNTQFFTNSEFSGISFYSFLNEEHLIQLQNHLDELDEKIKFAVLDQDNVLVFFNNSFTSFPENFLGADYFEFKSDVLTLVIEEDELSEIKESTFEKQDEVSVRLFVGNEKNMKILPTAFQVLNITEFDVGRTQVSFGFYDFSVHPNLKSIFLPPNLVPQDCDEEVELRFQHGIFPEVNLVNVNLDCNIIIITPR
eukprot:snap_masked-scaffold_10-processed-gene-13.11-mRNA-1 protein AED:1.00 eAED:1.00 QI:0/-1/0/0/-1/1/1/0/474